MATLQQLEQALIRADAAGDMDAARQLAAAIKAARAESANQIPGTQVPGTTHQEDEPSLMDKAIGVGETALSMGTAAIGGTVGMAAGALRGAGEMIVHGQYGTQEGGETLERNAMGAAQALTYSPRTKTGQQYTQAVGKAVGEVLPPVLPMMAAPGAITQGIKSAAPVAAVAARRAAAPVVSAAQKVGQQVQQAMPQRPAFGGGSISAAEVEAGQLRQARADEIFGGDFKMTQGQRTRKQEQQRFEVETAKDPERGEALRQRMAEQQELVRKKLDQWVDSTGAEAPDDMRLRSVGIAVDDAARAAYSQAKARTRAAYKKAEDSGELEDPVDMTMLVEHLNNSQAEIATTSLVKTATDLAVSKGIAKWENGSLVPVRGQQKPYGSLTNEPVTSPINIRIAEQFRQAINKNTDDQPVNIRQATIIKQLVDQATEGKGGELYRSARNARVLQARDFENVTLMSSLLKTKRGSSDRMVALEDVLDKAILRPSTSLDQTMSLGRILKKSPQGQQAWKELQGATLAHLRDKAFKNITSGENSKPVFNPKAFHDAVTALDKTGKLDYVFGKKGAENIRSLNDLAKDSFTTVPNAGNTSNTASVFAGAMDLMISAGVGVPAPIATATRMGYKMKKDAAIKKRVNEALQ